MQNNKGALILVLAAGSLMYTAATRAQSQSDTFTAIASMKAPAATASAQAIIRIDRYASDAERDKLLAVIKTGDDAAICDALAAMPDAGTIDVGTQHAAIKYAYQRPSGGGRLITVVTAEPLLYVGGAAPKAPAPKEHAIALALLVLDEHGHGDGELAPASTVKIDDKGAIVTSDYAPEVIRLIEIAKTQ